MKKKLSIFSLCVTLCSSLWAGEFADLGLSSDCEAVNLQQIASFFPDGPSKQTNGVVGFPDVLLSSTSASVACSSIKQISQSEGAQTVILKSGENITVTNAGWEYVNKVVRYVTQETPQGKNDLEKAAWALEQMKNKNLFSNDFPWVDAQRVLLKPGKRGEYGYLLNENDLLNPQVDVIRVGKLPDGKTSFVEVGFVEGPL